MPKTVLITGASRGIGRACALGFAARGMNVVINYNKSEHEAKSLLAEIEAAYGNVRALTVKADVSDAGEVGAMFEVITAELGGADILVNNAGISISGLFTDITDAERDRVFGVNVYGAFNCTRAALPYMIHEKYGRIINISSMWGVSGASCEVHYSASKAALIGFTRALSKELAPSGITVNAVAPGVIDTDMNARLDGDAMRALCEETPVGRLGAPRDVAAAVLFLSSDEAGFITGQTVTVDGGFLM